MPDPNYVSEIEREDGTVLTIKDAEARASISNMNPTLQQILQGVNDIKSSIGDTNAIIEEILSGDIPTEDVIFYDYDGTVVETYTAKEFAALTEMPANPTHAGLTSQGWNWSLSDAKTYVEAYGKLNIGQMYITDDGATRIYVSISDYRKSPVLRLYLNNNSTIDIDWGDGSAHSTLTSTSADFKTTAPHEYSTGGDYVISISATTGSFELRSQQYSVSYYNFTNILSEKGGISSQSPNKVYVEGITKVEIGSNVTVIGMQAFGHCYELSSITIPAGVTSISSSDFPESYTFYACTSLKSITIPNTVESFTGSGVFYGCYELESISLPNTLTNISDSCFRECSSLKSVTLPSAIETIDGAAFYDCYSLQSITIPEGVTSIGGSAFGNCYVLKSVALPDVLMSIGPIAFYKCHELQSITIPEGVTSIGNNAFNECTGLMSATLPSTLAAIPQSCFEKCEALQSITIPEGVTSIGNNAFKECYALRSITLPNTLTTILNSAFSNCRDIESVIIPDSIETVSNGAFNGCSSLHSVYIPEGLTNMDMFASCTSLKSVTLPSTTTSVYFSSCTSLQSLTIPEGVTSILNQAFYSCSSLMMITIPEGVTSIGQYAFYACYSLISITLPSTLTSINANAFKDCSDMTYIRFESTTPPTVSNSNAWSSVSGSTILYVPALVSNLYMNGTNYPAKASYKYIGYATYESGVSLPTTTTDETHTLTWYATSADATAQTNPITTGTGNEVYSRATPVA